MTTVPWHLKSKVCLQKVQPCAQLWIVNNELWGWSSGFPTQQAQFQIQREWCIPPLSSRAEVRADLAVSWGTNKNTEEMERRHLRVDAGEGFGKAARKLCAYVNKNVHEGFFVWLEVVCGTETCMITVPEVSPSRLILWLNSPSHCKYRLKWRFCVLHICLLNVNDKIVTGIKCVIGDNPELVLEDENIKSILNLPNF